MSSKQVRNTFTRGRVHNYLIAGNLCNAFAIGALGANDDFFLAGAEPAGESNYPLLTGNLIGADGKVLCRLVKNVITVNPGSCSKVQGDYIGYEIRDQKGYTVCQVLTKFERLPGDATGCFVTTLTGSFHDKSGKVALLAAAGDESEQHDAQV
jgi:hypothetical protein